MTVTDIPRGPDRTQCPKLSTRRMCGAYGRTFNGVHCEPAYRFNGRLARLLFRVAC
jgi:hypothetical protein